MGSVSGGYGPFPAEHKDVGVMAFYLSITMSVASLLHVVCVAYNVVCGGVQ